MLYLSNPDGLDQATRRRMLDDLKALNELKLEEYRDPEIATRISCGEYFKARVVRPELPWGTDEIRQDFEGELADVLLLVRRHLFPGYPAEPPEISASSCRTGRVRVPGSTGAWPH